MSTIKQRPAGRRAWGMAFIILFLFTTVIIFAANKPISAEPLQKFFSSPEDALKSLTSAVMAKDKDALDQIFGPAGKELRSGDSVQDAAEFEDLAKHLAEKTALVPEGDAKVILHIGNENWPFPVPLVKKDNQWFFDTKAGKEEILNRRIGENELTAILVCRAYVKAQREYTLKDWDGDGIFSYAQKLRSDPGKKNGLFWRSAPGEEVSPLGELVAKAWHEGYKKEKNRLQGRGADTFSWLLFPDINAAGEKGAGWKIQLYHQRQHGGRVRSDCISCKLGEIRRYDFYSQSAGQSLRKESGPGYSKAGAGDEIIQS